MKKYFTVFKTSWANELEYRGAFLLARTRNIIYLLLLYYVWLNLSQLVGRFAGYSTGELVTYVFGVHILRSLVFGAQSRLMAWEINDGTFSIFLVRPVNHFWFVFFRELAQRLIYFASAVFELAIFAYLTKASLMAPSNLQQFFVFLIACIGALFLYFVLSYLVSLFAFWSREAMGPRFLFEWFMEFGSGAFFPLNILSGGLFFTLQLLPFIYLIFFPMLIYLGRMNLPEAFTKMAFQLIWICAAGTIAHFTWRRGLRRYSGEGI